ncbi:hypothetical protein AQUCO_01300899v1 [Aquilegia coerulea]|uniref:RRM domain-containing protein n=1 Tax=Aquilegia coerulea TaxID=218851 RepID=A0A2G5E452_AQUCA|nr:hypothetical protein AQUCO_01300899v1 [Aquilegia coerulea]
MCFDKLRFSFMYRYMQTHSQVPPKATEVQTEVGGSLYLLKGIFLKLKDKVFSDPQSGKILTGESLDTREDATNAKASEVIKTDETLHAIELDEPQSRVQPSESMTDPNNHRKSIETCLRSDNMSKGSSKDSARPSDSSESEKIVEPGDEIQQCKVDPRIFGVPRQGEAAASNPLYCSLNGSVCEEEKAVRDLDGSSSGEKILMEEEQCPTNGKFPTCLVSNKCSEQKEMLSPFNSVQMSMSSYHKSLTSEIHETTVDSNSCEVGKTDEILDAAEVDELSNTFERSNNVQLVERGNEYQQCKGAAKVVSPLLCESAGDEGKATKTSELVGSTEEASMDYAGTSPANSSTHLASNASCGARDFSPTSDNAKEVLGLTELVETSSGHSMETSRDDSGQMQVKGLIDVVKNLPKYSLVTKHDDLIISDKIKSFTDGRLPRDKSQAIITDETVKHIDPVKEKQSLARLFRHDKHNEQVQHKSQMKGPKGRGESETILQETDNGTLTQLDDSLTGVKNPSLGSDDDTIKKVPSEIVDSKTRTDFLDSDDETIEQVTSEIVDSQTRNEYENGINCDGAAFGKSKPSPQIPRSSPNRLKRDAILSHFSEIDFLDSDVTTKKVPSERINCQTRNEYKSGRNSEGADFDYRRSKPSETIPLPSQKESTKRTLNPLLFTEKGRGQTDLLVRFVPISQNVIDIQKAFKDCGPIDEIHFITSNSVKMFKDAYVRFKTKEGMRKALTKSDAISSGSDVVVEAVSPSTYSSIKIHAPNQIGVTGVPTSLVKNPTRTVMVKGLAHNLALHHLEDVFSFCGARITGFFMGSSSSVAYIEFETEDAKEKAIATGFIPISVHMEKLKE